MQKQPPYPNPYPTNQQTQYRPNNQNPQKNISITKLIQGIGYLIGLILCIVFFINWVLPSAQNNTPAMDTLNTYCNALKSHDYQNAYDQFSQNNKQFTSEADFMAFMDNADKQFEGITGCSTINLNENDSSGIANADIFLNYGNGTSITGNVKLTNENGAWKINEMKLN